MFPNNPKRGCFFSQLWVKKNSLVSFGVSRRSLRKYPPAGFVSSPPPPKGGPLIWDLRTGLPATPPTWWPAGWGSACPWRASATSSRNSWKASRRPVGAAWRCTAGRLFPFVMGQGRGGVGGGAEYLGEDHWRYPVSSGYERVNLLLTFMVQQDIGLSPDKSFWQHPWKGGG